MNEISTFRKQIEGPLREASHIPYPIQSPEDAYIYSALHSLSNAYIRPFLITLTPPVGMDAVLNHLEAPLQLVYYHRFEWDVRLMGTRRLAQSRCMLLHVGNKSRQQKCLANVISLYGPMDAQKGQSLPWILIRGLLIAEGIYPNNGFRDLRSTCGSMLSGFSKMRSLEIRASQSSIKVDKWKRTKKPVAAASAEVNYDKVVYDEAASFMLTFQETINCFLRHAIMNKRNAEAAFYQSVLMRFRGNDLFRHLLDGEKQLTWQKCFPWMASAAEPTASAYLEIQKLAVFTFFIICCLLFRVFVL